MPPILLLTLLGCADPAAVAPPAAVAVERDLAHAGEGAWRLRGHALELRGGTLHADGAPVLSHVYDAPVAGPDTLWVPADPGQGDGGIYAVSVEGGGVVVEPLLTEGRPDRLALSADADTIAFVAGLSGIASVWVLPTEGGTPRQVTNVGVRRSALRGGPPAGFEPSPARGSLHFDGDALRWSEPDGALRERAWR